MNLLYDKIKNKSKEGAVWLYIFKYPSGGLRAPNIRYASFHITEELRLFLDSKERIPASFVYDAILIIEKR